jgi:hypothetical protein
VGPLTSAREVRHDVGTNDVTQTITGRVTVITSASRSVPGHLSETTTAASSRVDGAWLARRLSLRSVE